ncbi:MAG: response regulator transcription factor [Gammaproteobacteria bacterium]|nr:response regulator transcription factor [Gammaproteobacteria bacterium]
MANKILIIEDESRYAYILEKYYTNDGFEVKVAFDGLQGFNIFKEFLPDIVVLDIMLPGLDGYEVAKRIRQEHDTPIIMMSALSEEQDILKGYTLQIDDYITKPFRIPILIAKTRNLLERRKSLKERGGEETLQVGKIKLIRNNLECYIEDQLVKLTKTEFKLLEYLMLNAGKTCTREQLILILWGDKGIENRIIDTYVKSLRKMLGENATITTIFGIGYKFEKE